jgi:hypothetical protein
VEHETVDTLRLLTLMMLTMFLHQTSWYAATPLSFLCMLGVVFPRVRASAATWALITGFFAYWAKRSWFEIDNHAYLYLIWMFTMFLVALVAREHQREAAATASRLLLGLVMALATLQKALSPSYVSGSFMEFLLLFEPRFQTPAWWAAGIDLASLGANVEQLTRWIETSAGLPDARLLAPSSSARLDAVSAVLTWGGIVVEGTVAATFLIPSNHARVVIARTTMLIVFVVVTYPIAPVVAFGWVLLVLGLAQVPPGFPRLGVVVLATFFLLPFCAWSPAKLVRLF